MECGRPHRPTPPRRPHCPGWSDDFRTRFDEADFMEDEMFVEEAVNLSAGCGCRPKPPVCPPSCGCDNDTDDQDDDDRPGCGNRRAAAAAVTVMTIMTRTMAAVIITAVRI